MRLAFFVLDVATEVDEYTTTRLARAAVQGGHEVWYVGVGDVETAMDFVNISFESLNRF